MTELAEPATPVAEETKQENAVVISEDLLDKKKAMKAVVTTHNLLMEGAFPRKAFEAVLECQTFLKSLHAELTAAVLAHPDVDKDPELKILKEPKDGQSQSA